MSARENDMDNNTRQTPRSPSQNKAENRMQPQAHNTPKPAASRTASRNWTAILQQDLRALLLALLWICSGSAWAAATTTVLSATPNPGVAGQTIAITATVTGAAPTGTVTFMNGATAMTTVALPAGQNRITYNRIFAAGNKNLSAIYNGDVNNSASTSAVYVQTINKAASSTTISVLPNPLVVGQAATLTASVTGYAPSGTVTFKNGTAILGTAAVASNKATLNYTFGTTGAYSLTAEYGGNTNNLSSISAPVSGTVRAAFLDLVMTGISTTSTAAIPGNAISISDSLKNQGTIATTTGCRAIGYYLSTDNLITTADTLIGSRQQCGALAAGATNTNTAVSITIPPATASRTTYYLGAIADYTGLETESNETNNSRSSTATIRLAQLSAAPGNVVAQGGNTNATVSFGAPADNGGLSITGYTVTSIPAGGVDSGAGKTGLIHSITGLTNGTAYTFTVTATTAVGTSAASVASNSITPNPVAPSAPRSVVATGSNASATVTFLAPIGNGGSAITGYTVTSIPAGGVDNNAGTTGLSHSITGLANGTVYTFTVTARNAAGTSVASAASNSITPAPIAPSAPSNVRAAGGVTQATVTFDAPTKDGGSAITGYTVSSNPPGLTDSHAGTPVQSHVMTGMASGTTYSFTVKASNAAGTSVASAPSNSVTAGSNVGQAYYIHADHLDTPRQITDTAGNVVWDWQNTDPYGNNEPNENPSGQGTFTCNLRHSGQYFDIETGLFQNHFRDYDPSTGRYIEADPIGTLLYQDMAAQNLSAATGFISPELATSLYGPDPKYNHLYTYVKGNPISRRDTKGLDWDQMIPKDLPPYCDPSNPITCSGPPPQPKLTCDLAKCAAPLAGAGKDYVACRAKAPGACNAFKVDCLDVASCLAENCSFK